MVLIHIRRRVPIVGNCHICAKWSSCGMGRRLTTPTNSGGEDGVVSVRAVRGVKVGLGGWVCVWTFGGHRLL